MAYCHLFGHTFWLTTAHFGLQPLILAYNCPFWSTTACFGLQLPVFAYNHLFLSTTTCFGLQSPVLVYSHPFWSIVTCFGLQPPVLVYNHLFWSTITCFGLQPPVMTLFLLSLLLWTLELYSILSHRYEDLLISWSYRSYLDDLILAILSDLLILSSDDDPRYVSMNFTLLLTCIRHAFDPCLSLMIDMHSTHVAVQHAFTICLTCFEHMFYMCLPWGQHMDIGI